MEGGREQNYWPAFVDALSNVILTLIFVIAIFVLALALAANKVAQQAATAQTQQEEQKNASASPAEPSPDLAKENEALRQQLAQAELDLEKLRASGSHGAAAATSAAQTKEVDITVEDKVEQKVQPKAIGIEVSGDKIVINYPLSVADLDSKSAANLERLLGDFKHRLGKRKILIRSISGGEPFSAAQRYSYYRAVSIRNYLISKDIADGNSISNLIVPPSTEGGGRVEIIFEP